MLYQFPIEGAHCDRCLEQIRNSLASLTTTTIHQLDLHWLEVESSATFAEIVDTIRLKSKVELGYQQHLSLDGLSCSRCVAKVQTTLTDSPFYSDIEVTKTSLKLRSALPLEATIKQVVDCGYNATPFENLAEQQIVVRNNNPNFKQNVIPDNNPEPKLPNVSHQLLIKGMTCASCVRSVEQALLGLDTVTLAQVNLSEQTANITADIKLDPQQLLAAVSKAGYQAEILTTDSSDALNDLVEEQVHQHKKSAIAGLAIGAPLMLWGLAGGNMMIRSSTDQLIWGLVGLTCLWLLSHAGKHFFTQAWQALIHKRATMDTLVALGTGSAWLFSMLVVSMPSLFPAAARHVYFEASAMIIGLISLGHYIEAKAKVKTRASLNALLSLQTKTATQIVANKEVTITMEQVKVGMILRVKPGEQLPVDGLVVSGESYVDESMLTGEPYPMSKAANETVSAGTVNQDGTLDIQAQSIGEHTKLSQIIDLVRKAQSSKPQLARLADRVSSVFVPVVVAIALIAGMVWFFVGPEPQWSYTLIVTTSVLIIACPCALGLATPLSITVGIGKASEHGILIKDADALQQASKVDMVVFDKTGTLTMGKPKVQSFFTTNEYSEHTLTALASLEAYSEHPIAKAIVEYSQHHHLEVEAIEGFHNQRGQGVSGDYRGVHYQALSPQAAKDHGIDLSPIQEALSTAEQNAQTAIVVIRHNQAIGLVGLSDPVKPESKQSIDNLHRQGIQTALLTGDNRFVAEHIAQQLGIENVYSEVLPDQKATHIDHLQAQGYTVAMIGDGINDGPALATADVGIAMATGSDVAIESAQVTLLNSSPMSAVTTIAISKATLMNMKQNLFGAFIYNTLGIPIAAGVLYPAFGILLSPVVAGTAMALSSITVVSNANRLRHFSPYKK
ncbi:heavy metal translocating P-type ATPase [Vibrio sp. FNV 38]|nr:heavy metal translocating P-type ATPase [Vibrio sp. FNV 38]